MLENFKCYKFFLSVSVKYFTNYKMNECMKEWMKKIDYTEVGGGVYGGYFYFYFFTLTNAAFLGNVF